MNKQITAVLVGAGNRADVYARTSFTHPEKLKIVGIVDPDPVRRKLMGDRYNVPETNRFVCVEDFVQRDRFADCVINGTMDHLHIATSVPVLDKGYHLLLEKPFAVNEAEVETLTEAARRNDRKVVIGHVLRYTSFYKAIKQHLLNGDIGRVISIEMCEHVNYLHMATSYVRGKWRSEKLCFAPMLLAKSCHDMDIMMWMMNDTAPALLSSFGGDFQYGADRKPPQAGTRCMVDCPLEQECSYAARNAYLSCNRWPAYVWRCLDGAPDQSMERKEHSLKTDNPYGRCVWDFERDGNVDHQTVMVQFRNGATGTFSMIGGSARSERNIHIIGTKGELKGTFEDSTYILRWRTPEKSRGYTDQCIDLNIIGDKTGEKGGHADGDRNLVLDFIDYLNGHAPTISCTTLEDSRISHLVVFKAMEAMYTGSVVAVDLHRK